MGRSRFPGKPLKFQNRKRISVLSGAVYNETASESHPPARGGAVNDFAVDKEEEEKKENNNEYDVNATSEIKLSGTIANDCIDNPDQDGSDSSKSPVRTRSQNKMEPPKSEKPKPVKKTVTFGTVESCEDIFLPLKKIPLKHHAPLVPIIKKKSSLKQTEYSTFNSILKPAKLTDLSSKSTSDHQEGYLKKHLNPLSKPMNKFSQISESRCMSPPPRNMSPIEKESSSGSAKFVLPVRSAHSSRVIKPNKKFIDGDDHAAPTSNLGSGKVLKKPKLKRLVFNNIPDDDSTADETGKINDNEKTRDKQLLASSSLFKDKTTNSFSAVSSGSRKQMHDLFSYEKDPEYSQDENSNLESPEGLKSSESNKEDRGHAMRKLMDISDASSSTSTSGSESEESWESESPRASGDEDEKPAPPSPEKEKATASQLLRGKVIIREARLQLNPPTQSTSGLDGPFSTLTSSTSNNPPTTVTCGVCGAVRFYRFVKQARKFGIYSCESCRKFISKMLKKEKMSQRTGPVLMQCLKGEGNCHVPPIVRSQQWKLLRCANKARCPACWLKMCLKAFQVPPSIRTGLTAMLPTYMRSTATPAGPLAQVNPLRVANNSSPGQPMFSPLSNNDNENKIFATTKASKKPTEDVEKPDEEKNTPKEQQVSQEGDDDFGENRKRRLTRIKVRKKDKSESKQVEDPKRQKVELKGPRVKHVCRSASIVLGQPIATFPTSEEKEKQEKNIAMEEDPAVLPETKDIVIPDLSSCESEVDVENKAPLLPVEASNIKDSDAEMIAETKKRKMEPLVSVKLQNKSESSEDETVMDLVPRKTVIKTLTNITNVRGRSQKCGQNRPELICVDFWESYDPDEVCSSGFGLIGTASFTVARLCFLCGSAGRENMMVCSSCCEWYHSWCAEDVPGGGGWTCARCVSCAACARSAAAPRLRCRSCARHYHAACLPTAPPDHRSDWPQVCSSCCEWYHSWCAEDVPGGGGWTCARCVSCAACARSAAAPRLRCRSCARHYHAACLPTAPPDHRSDWPQVCSSCCEWYHSWCAEDVPGGGGWTCARCVSCAACARSAAAPRLRCRSCARHYHAACLPTAPPDHRSDWPQVCSSCCEWYHSWCAEDVPGGGGWTCARCVSCAACARSAAAPRLRCRSCARHYHAACLPTAPPDHRSDWPQVCSSCCEWYHSWCAEDVPGGGGWTCARCVSCAACARSAAAPRLRCRSCARHYHAACLPTAPPDHRSDWPQVCSSCCEWYHSWCAEDVPGGGGWTCARCVSCAACARSAAAPRLRCRSCARHYHAACLPTAPPDHRSDWPQVCSSCCEWYHSWCAEDVPGGGGWTCARCVSCAACARSAAAPRLRCRSCARHYHAACLPTAPPDHRSDWPQVCSSCCEWYHSWCAEDVPGGGGWTCARCVSCAACARSAAAPRLRCRSCARHYHAACLPTAPPDHRSDWPQVCSSCCEWYHSWCAEDVPGGGGWTCARCVSCAACARSAAAPRLRCRSCARHYHAACLPTAPPDHRSDWPQVCSSCCEWYHSWCAEDVPGGGGWTCARCVSCAACARSAAAPRLRCRSCARHYHAACLPTAPPDHRSDWPQVCSSCCEWYHSWCAEDVPGGGGWTCARCVSCAACARSAAAPRLRCRSCARHYHAACLPTAPPDHRSDWPQVCSSCCEWYHSWCAEDVPGGGGWTCARCVSCAACARSAAAPRLRCRSCARHYHAACLPTAPPDHRSDWPQICSACLKCKSCDSSRVSKFVGSLPFCGPCFKLRQKGNYCPLCQACYRDNDFDSKMMECGWCGRWVHASCEGLSGEGYQLLSALPPSIEYICCKCMPGEPPWRKMLTEHLKGRLLHLLKLLAKNKKACALLKLTPHKNTPVPNKPYRLMSPQAIRKLHFDGVDESMKNTTETKVYRNTARGRRNNNFPQTKFDDASSAHIWHCSSLLADVEMEKEEIPHTSHKVVNLQEPLMQNKEICFSTGLYGTKTEFDAPCVEVHENYTPQNKTEKATAMLPTTVHDDKYEAISDDDEPMKVFPPTRSEQDLSPAVIRQSGSLLDNTIDDLSRIVSPSLLDIKKRVNSDEYVSLKDFNHDMKDVVERTSSDDLQNIYKDLFTETFPWFDCENNCLQPNLEVDGEQEDVESLKDHEMSDRKRVKAAVQSIERPLDQIVPKLESEGQNFEEDLLELYPMVDSRICVLCKTVGDGSPAMEGRLLYCGQNDWIHANCALWSAEVFEEIDGSLQNVHSAISRGKMIKCAACEVKGASVGCCAKNCSETYHYACARKESCAFMDDKRVFCPTHGKDVPVKSLQKDADFELTRPVYVELDKKKKRYSEINKVQFLLGSLTVHSLGKIVPSVSDFEEFLMPVDFSCTRLFWSCKKPSKIVRYTIKTKLILAEPLPGFDYGVNITVDHTMDIQVVERVMAEIGAWHENVESGSGKNVLMLKNDKSPMKLGNTVTLEDFAVKQVVEFLVDNVCKQEQQDEEEPQNTADLLPPELKDAIFEDLNHDLLDGISMQDIFPNPYEDLVAMDLKNEFYTSMSQADDKSNDKSDFIDELLNARLESGSKELKRSKSDILQNHNLKSLSTGRGQQRSSSLTWNNKFDTTLLSSTIKRCKIGRTSTITGKLSPIQKLALVDNPLETLKETDTILDKKIKTETNVSNSICDETPHTSGLNYQNTSPKEKDESAIEKTDKTEVYYTDVIDFYTKIHCSPISQLDGAADWSGSESNCSSRPNSPRDNDNDFAPIQQLDGAEDHNPNDNTSRNQTNQFLYRTSGTESTYTVTISGNAINGQPELVMRPLDDGSGTSSHMEQPVRCDRCQCTYRNKESYDRHVPSCDMMSTSESESENPKSPENRTLTTLQNAFQGAFAQPMIIHAGVVSGSENTVKAENISARRTSINTRQITINGTIVETPSPGPSNEMTMTISEQMKSGTMIYDQNKTANVQVSANQQLLSSPQIVVTPQMLLPPKTSSAGGQKIMTPQIITQPGILPYNICVKPGNGNPNIQQIQGSADMTQLLAGGGGIQVIASNSNQVLTIPSNQSGLTSMMHGKNNFPNLASATSIALPVNSIQGMPNASIIQNIQPMIRPQMQGNTIVVPAMTAQRLNSPNAQNKQHILLPGNSQKSPKKQPAHVQPKPIFQAANRGRGRPMPKPTTIKRQTKMEKTYTTINQSPLGAGNTVIQLQTNNQTGQPSIIVQPVANQNLMSAYVEALSQQQNQNMQYIATIAPQGDFKTGPTQFISQGGLVPQTFQIQQTESGSLVAVPSGGIPVLIPQGNVGILPQTLQQGATILPQGAIQTQGILSQGPNGHTILPQAIHTQNGTTIIPQGTIQGLTSGNLNSQTATLLPNNLQTGGATVVPQSGIGNGQTTIIPNALQSQGATILPQGTLLPQFCNDQVILGSTPTLEMVTDPSGCMYLTTTQPVYYGLETIVQNTVMSSQQFVSTAMQGVLAQNSSFSATTTQVFQASKIEPIVEVPTGYVVVNNVGDGVATSAANLVTAQSVQSSPQSMKGVKTSVPNLTLQPLPDKSNNSNRHAPKVIQMTSTPIAVCPQSGSGMMAPVRQNINPITSQIHTMTLSSTPQNLQRANILKQSHVSMAPNVTLVTASGQPVMAISHTVPNSASSFTMQSMPLSQPIVSSSISQSGNKNNIKIENAHVIEISGNLQDCSHSVSMPTISVTQSIKSPTPWRQMNPPNSSGNSEAKIEIQNTMSKSSTTMNTPSISIQSNVMSGRSHPHNEAEKVNQNCLVSMSNNVNSMSSVNLHSNQFEAINVSHHLPVHSSSNNVIQITAGNIYPPSSIVNSFDADTTLKLSKINALSKAEGGHLNFSHEIMASHSQHGQNEKSFQNMGANDNKHNTDNINNQMNVHKLNSCQVAGNMSAPAISIIPHNVMRPQMQGNQNTISVLNNQNQMTANSSSHGQMQVINSSGNNSMQNVNISCQEVTNNRVNITVSSDNSIQQNQQHDITSTSMNSSNLAHGNMQMISHDNSQLSTSNQIHIMNGQIQHNRQVENSNQMQQINQGNSNRTFHENIVGVQQAHNQSTMLSNRSTPDTSSLMNQSMNMHSMGNNHNINRSDLNDLNHMHMQQPMSNINNMQNNRMIMDNMQSHAINGMGHQMHPNRQMDNMHNTQLHNMQPMNHHLSSNNNRPQVDNNMHINQQMTMQQSRQMDNVGHHHQHQLSNVMQMQNNRQHIDSNLMGMHQHGPNQMHNRQQMDGSIHMHHMSGNATNMSLGNQLENPVAMSNMHGNRHDNNSLGMQNLNVINQMQSNRNSIDTHSSLIQHQMNNMNNMSMHNNLNNSMQISNNNHQSMNSSLMHVPNIPDIKNEIQSSCSGSCSTNNAQFSTNHSSFEICSNMNATNNMNMGSGNIVHGMNVNNANMSNNNNMMIGAVNNSSLYGSSSQNSMASHDMLMSCNNSTDHNVPNHMPGNSNHMIINNTQSHVNANQNPILSGSIPININSCSLTTNNTPQNQITPMDNQLNRGNMPVNESPKFTQEPMRGKNIMGPPSNTSNMPMSNIPNNDCAKVSIVGNDKQNHAISVSNQIGYMQMNSQNNRVINLPERNRLSNANIDNMNVPQQHNIRVVTNNSNNNATDPFQQKSENSGTMINVPFQAIPNSAPMNINVNSSNNTVNITVQNNLVDPKIASKAAADISFPLQSNTNILQNQNNNSNMICIPVQNNTISLPTQNSSSITLPKAPPTQQSGIPTNVVNPMSMRPMNRVLPLHRDGQSKTAKSASATKTIAIPRPRPVGHDMPDLNIKDETNDSDLEKAIEESKRMMELERVKREKEEIDAARAIQLSTDLRQANSSSTPTNADNSIQVVDTTPKMTSLPNLDAEIIEVEPPKVLIEKEINRLPVPKTPSAPVKVMKRPLGDKKSEVDAVVTKKQNKVVKGQENKSSLPKQAPDPPKDDGPKLIYEVTSEDGFNYSSSSLTDLWAKVLEAVQNARKQTGLPLIEYSLPSSLSGAHLLGLNNNALRYLIEQLPGASRCTKYKIGQGRQLNSWDNDLDLSEGFKESPWGSARTGPVARKQNHDMFSWMASPFREEPPPFGAQEAESSISRRLATLPPAMRFRQLKETSKASVGVYRSHIHGRGLFCKRDIEEGDMVIEYAGEVIRAVLADQREKKYEAMSGRRGVGGCYMFRIDDNLVVDATLKGNAARFINHSCDPNCYSRVVDIHGHKHILIFALRRITIGEELTYDYKFPFEEVKIPCTCGAKKCRKYLN